MIFETHDLSKASPATISRCGMVYMAEDSFGGPETLLASWLNSFTKRCDIDNVTQSISDALKIRMKNRFKYIFKEIVHRVK